MKFITQVFLPAAGTLYFALAGIWHLPNADQVVGTVLAIDTFLGVSLHLNSKAYNSNGKYDGDVDVVEVDGKKTFKLNLNSDPIDLDQKNQIIFKVNK